MSGWCGSRARVEAGSPEEQEVLRSACYRWGFEFLPDGPDTTLVTETFDCTRSPDELREAVREGEGWRDAITSSLAKLDQLATITATT